MGMRCPMCRAIVTGVSPVSMSHLTQDSEECDADVVFPVDGHFGVTVTDTLNGVRVTGLDPRDKGRRFLCTNDVITRINGIPAVHHRDVIRVIDECTLNSIEVRLRVLRNRTTAHRLFPFLSQPSALSCEEFSTLQERASRFHDLHNVH